MKTPKPLILAILSVAVLPMIVAFQSCARFQYSSITDSFDAEENSVFTDQAKSLGSISVGSASIANPRTEILMDKFFSGQATLRPIRSMPKYDVGGAWIAVQNGTWYLYDRLPMPGLNNSVCRGRGFVGVGVRSSHDQGRTWSDQRLVISPTLNPNDYDACEVVDGATFYDSETGTWHIWSQCLSSDQAPPPINGWHMCHYTSDGPMNPFRRSASNYAVGAGSIWRDICRRPDSGCPSNTSDEGTPEILFKRDGYFYVTFHGFDAMFGYRGMARTRDFFTFELSGDEVPQKALMNARDTGSWNPWSIGPGKSSTILTSKYNYQLVEAPTLSLLCVDGQYWPIGLVRSRLGAGHGAGNWELSSPSPLITPEPGGISCALAYATMFVDGDNIFVYYLRYLERYNKGVDARQWNLYQVVDKNSGAPTNPSDPRLDIPLSGTPMQRSVTNPLLQFRIGTQVFKDSAWLGYSTDMGDSFCQVRFGSGWRVDLSKSTPALAQVNICNANISVDPITLEPFCEYGKTGSYYQGYVYSTIACIR